MKGGIQLGQSSESLVKEILKGNEAAMELLVRKNYNMVQSFIYRFIGDYNLSYDMTQEVFIKMMKNLNSFKKINMDNTRERNSIKANDV